MVLLDPWFQGYPLEACTERGTYGARQTAYEPTRLNSERLREG